ncbi:hypothetical protein F971_01724 [Acinetobacter vivianii]|uniref:Uncharacterized protein n=1 Tax=Acinetobacter vivianii TaxID=1776742 RepID=N8WBQ8_9GAMM|nr:hypothetical protein [Acinetobacter vivianii]ENU92737.1 hypothetical protein F971_01724 [Acinetobacter vivianii]
MHKSTRFLRDPRVRLQAITEAIRPGIVVEGGAADNLQQEEKEQTEVESLDLKEGIKIDKKCNSFKKKEVIRGVDVSGTAPTRPSLMSPCLIQDLITYASNNENIWKYDKHEKKLEKLVNLYFKEYGFDETLRVFIVKFFIFMDGVIDGKTEKAIWVKNMDPNAFVSKESLTLIGQRYFTLLNEYYECNIPKKMHVLDSSDLYNFLKVFEVIEDGTVLWKLEVFTNKNALFLNNMVLDFKENLIAHKAKFKKNFDNINYINEKIFQKIFIKDRLILRFEFKSADMDLDVRLLSRTFANLMKRLKGEYRLSEDINYIKFINEKNSKKYLDVLFFIEINEKFNSVKEVIESIQDHWVRSIYNTLDKSKSEEKIYSERIEIDAKIKNLMKSESLFDTEGLYVGSRDKAKIKAVIDILIPYFISLAIFLPVESTLSKTRQLTLVGFGTKY